MNQFWISVAAGALLMTAAPTASQAQTAGAPPASARQMELARKVINDTGGTRAFDQMFHAMIGAMTAQMSKGQPEAAQNMSQNVVGPALEATMDKLMPKITDAATAAYAQTYTEQELADIDAFYQSPSGRSMVAKLPQIASALAQSIGGIQVEMRHDMVDEMCKRMVCTDALRARMLGQPAAGQP